jgi:squalene cyclase
MKLATISRSHVGEADWLCRQVACAPQSSDVEIAFELDFEPADRDAACDRVDADRKTRVERGKRGLDAIAVAPAGISTSLRIKHLGMVEADIKERAIDAAAKSFNIEPARRGRVRRSKQPSSATL